MVDVAAIFQKDPQVLIAHPDRAWRFRRPRQAADHLHGQGPVLHRLQWMKAAFPASRTSRSSPIPSTRRRSSPTRVGASRATSPPSPIEIEKQGGFKPEGLPDGRRRLRHAVDHDRSQAGLGREQPGHRPALRRCLDHRLVQLPLRRQQGRQRADQERQPRDDRRPDRVHHRQDEGVRPGRSRAAAERAASAACRSRG